MDAFVSNCCYAPIQGEQANTIDDTIIEGRCSDCKEMAAFITFEEEEL